jgi:hypothetical protein
MSLFSTEISLAICCLKRAKSSMHERVTFRRSPHPRLTRRNFQGPPCALFYRVAQTKMVVAKVRFPSCRVAAVQHNCIRASKWTTYSAQKPWPAQPIKFRLPRQLVYGLTHACVLFTFASALNTKFSSALRLLSDTWREIKHDWVGNGHLHFHMNIISNSVTLMLRVRKLL